MSNTSEQTNKVATLKTMKIETTLNFCKLPQEDTQFTIEKSESNKLKTCDKLQVSFTRVNVKNVYGSKKDKIEKDADAIKNVGNFLKAFYESGMDEDSEKTESFEDWKNRYALSKVQLVLNQRARIEALRLENADVDKQIAALATLASAGKVDSNAIAQLEAMLAALKAA
jgi:hypothetical protein